jgi:glycosyltransferase involved in cell wall biosynthesis
VPDRIRVLWLIKGLGLGGAERLLERAIPYLDRHQFDYHVAYLLPWKGALVPAFREAKIPVHCLDSRRALDLGVLGRLASVLKEWRIDLVHAHLPLPGVLARLAKQRRAVSRVVYTEHSLPSRHHVLTRALNLITYPLNDAVIAVSEAVAGQVRQRLRNGRPQLVTIPNAIDPEMFEVSPPRREAVCREFGLPADAHLIVHVGNLRPVKGHRYLLAAARIVVEAEPRARFLLVGVGPLDASLREQARRLDLDGRVVFTGFRADAPALIGASDLFVLASLHEGIPVTLLEAMAAGRPAVLTRVGGIPEVVVEGKTAVLVEPQDERSLASAILALLRDPVRRGRMGEAARQHVHQRFGMARMVAAVEEVYRKVMSL